MAAALLLSAAAAAAAVLSVRAHYGGTAAQRQVYLFKPLATLLILALALALPQPVSGHYRWAVAAGLLFSTAGDIFLMLPRDRFIFGLASFLVAHLCYVAAFSTDVAFGTAPGWWLPYLFVGGAIVVVLWPGLKAALRGPVVVYVAVIAVMAGQAAARWDALFSGAALLALAGATLFVVSDAVLAIDRFRRPFAAARGVTLATYYSAQWLIALSVSAGELLP